jgi:hypothetical protein
MTAPYRAGVTHLIDQTQCGRTMQQATGSVPVARLGNLRDWEQGARRPGSAANAYLWVIEAAQDTVRGILHL